MLWMSPKHLHDKCHFVFVYRKNEKNDNTTEEDNDIILLSTLFVFYQKDIIIHCK